METLAAQVPQLVPASDAGLNAVVGQAYPQTHDHVHDVIVPIGPNHGNYPVSEIGFFKDMEVDQWPYVEVQSVEVILNRVQGNSTVYFALSGDPNQASGSQTDLSELYNVVSFTSTEFMGTTIKHELKWHQGLARQIKPTSIYGMVPHIVYHKTGQMAMKFRIHFTTRGKRIGKSNLQPMLLGQETDAQKLHRLTQAVTTLTLELQLANAEAANAALEKVKAELSKQPIRQPQSPTK